MKFQAQNITNEARASTKATRFLTVSGNHSRKVIGFEMNEKNTLVPQNVEKNTDDLFRDIRKSSTSSARHDPGHRITSSAIGKNAHVFVNVLP